MDDNEIFKHLMGLVDNCRLPKRGKCLKSVFLFPHKSVRWPSFHSQSKCNMDAGRANFLSYVGFFGSFSRTIRTRCETIASSQFFSL